MPKIDFKKEYKHLYNPPAKQITVVDVPPLNFLMADGAGDPNTSADFQAAMMALYGVSYTLKFMLKGGDTPEYTIMPLEALWWNTAEGRLDLGDKTTWQWTVMILQPSFITEAMVDEAGHQLEKKKEITLPPTFRLGTYTEGRAVQIMYIGPYADEGPTIERLHQFIREQGCELRGKHHEIYLGDPRRTAPEKLKTVIRQPFG
ncbi:MAG: GyrI-like domain-containing protein [Chloroflexota bacterium]